MAGSIPKKLLGGRTKTNGRNMFDMFSSFSAATPPGTLPLWTGEVIHSCDTIYPEFWQKAVSLKSNKQIATCTEAEYTASIASTGYCNKFVIDTDNKKIILPKISSSLDIVYSWSESKEPDGKSFIRIYSDGWCEQGGVTTIKLHETITNNPLHVRFNSINYNVILTIRYDNWIDGAWSVYVGQKTSDDFNIVGDYDQSSYDNKVPVYWTACGYIDLNNVKIISSSGTEDEMRNLNTPLYRYIVVYTPDTVTESTIQSNQILEQARQWYEKVRSIEISIKAEIDSLRVDNATASLPDMTRAVQMELTDYSMNDTGLIWKLNVPGWLVPHDRSAGRYDNEFDWNFHLANHPGYLYNYVDQGNYGHYHRPDYSNRRTLLAGMVTGSWDVHFPIPIIPGTSTYFHLGDASSDSWADKRLWFVPTRAVPKSYSADGFVTPISVTRLSISRTSKYDAQQLNEPYAKAVYAGNWTDNFKLNSGTGLYELDRSKLILPSYQYNMTGSGTWINGWFFYQTNVLNTGKDRVYWGSGGTYTMRFVSSAEVDWYIADLRANYSGYINNDYNGKTCIQWCEACRNKWIVGSWQCYRKQWLNKAPATPAGLDLVAHPASDYFQMPADLHGHATAYEGLDGWSFWQNVHMISVETNSDNPPSRSAANGSGQWIWGGAMRGYKDNLAYLPNCQKQEPIPRR